MDVWSIQSFVLLDSNPIAGESALDRLACGLGGKTMLPHVTTNIPQMLQNGLLLFVYTFPLSQNLLFNILI